MTAITLRRDGPDLIVAVDQYGLEWGWTRRRAGRWTVVVAGFRLRHRRLRFNACRELRQLATERVERRAIQRARLDTRRGDLADPLAVQTGRRWPW